MFTLGQLVAALLVPAIVVLALAPVRADQAPRWWVAGLAALVVAVAAAAGHLGAALAVGDAVVPPHRGWHWFIPGAALIAVAALVPGRWSSRVALAVATALAVTLVLRPLAGLEPVPRALWIGAAAVAVVVASTVGERALQASGPRWGHAQVLAWTLGVAVVIGLGGSKDLSLLAMTVTSAVAGSAVLALALRTPAAGLAGTVGGLLAGHLAIGAQYAEVPPLAAGLALAALPLAGLAAPLTGLRGEIVRLVLVLAALGSAIGVVLASAAPPSGY